MRHHLSKPDHSEEMKAKLHAPKLKSHIHGKGKCGKPLSEQAKKSNRAVRVRVGHIFGAQANDMGRPPLHTIGLIRARAKIGVKNIACNMRRLCQLHRMNPGRA